jgi:1-acyl-sn-glycerol-3-phosphate acyltransferase
MSALRSLVAFLWTIVITPIAAIFGFPWTWITGTADTLYAMAMWIAGVGLRIAGVRTLVEGAEHLAPTANYIFMSNHVSNLDAPVLLRALPGRTSVLVKKELFSVPVLGWAMRLGDLVPVDRANREAAVNSMREAGNVLTKGLHMTVFPEGTRSRDGRLLPFKKGPFYLAMDSAMPVVPVTILGSEALMPKGSMRIAAGTVRVVFHPPLLPASFPDKEALIEAVRASIASSLPAERRDQPTPGE